MLCSISGTPTAQPVVSKKSGHVFDKDVIEAFITEKGVCPITSQPLARDDLMPIVVSSTPHPRAVAATSVPGLLQTLKTEWDGVMLEQFTLRSTVEQLRTELSRHKYNYEAACRVITKLTQERDSARESLAALKCSTHTIASGADLSVGGAASSVGHSVTEAVKEMCAKIVEKEESLFAQRRQRKLIKNDESFLMALAEDSATQVHSTPSFSMCTLSDNFIVSGTTNKSVVLDVKKQSIVASLAGHKGAVTRVDYSSPMNVVLTGGEDTEVKVWSSLSYEQVGTLLAHSGTIRGICAHPASEYVFTGSSEGTIVASNLGTMTSLLNHRAEGVITNMALHPDGSTLGVLHGGVAVGYDPRGGLQRTTWKLTPATGGADLSSLTFSQNAYHFFTGSVDGVVSLFDLRKASVVVEARVGEPVESLSVDCSGTVLAAATAAHVRTLTAKDMKLVRSVPCASTSVVRWSDERNMSCSEQSKVRLYAATHDGFMKVFAPV